MSTAIEKQLQAMRLHSPDARKVFDALRNHPGKKSETEVDALRRWTNLRPTAIRAVLGELAQLELGELMVGRRGAKTRFIWFKGSWEAIPGPVKGEPKPGEPFTAITKGATPVTQMIFNLGGRREARLLLPANATKHDLRTLVRHLEKALGTAEA